MQTTNRQHDARVIRLAELNEKLGKPTAFVYRSLLSFRNASDVVPAPATKICRWIGVNSIYRSLRILREASLVVDVPARESSSGRGLLVFGRELPLAVIDSDGVSQTLLAVSDATARWLNTCEERLQNAR